MKHSIFGNVLLKSIILAAPYFVFFDATAKITPLHGPPTHEHRPWIRSSKTLEYQKKCNEISPLEDWPKSIQDYEKNYASLENDFKTSIISNSYNEEEIIHNLTIFIKNEMGLEVLPKQIHLKKSGIGNGLSGDKIYIVSDKNQTPMFIIKVFMKSKGKFSREFHTLTNHENLKLQTLNIPKVLGIGKAEMQNSLFFLAIDYIPGISVFNLFRNLANYQEESAEREEFLKKLVHIYEKLGEGLAEFHLSSKSHALPIHPVLQNLFKASTMHALIKLENHVDPIFLQKLRVFLEKNLSEMPQKIFDRGYYHGDLSVANLIHNPATDRLTLIDWPDGSFSVGKDGKPLGIPFYDLIQVKNELINMKIEGLTKKESSQLYNAFKSKYIERGLFFPSKEIMDLFSVLDLVGTLKWLIDKKEIFQKEEQEITKKIFQEKQQKLETLIT